MEYGTVNMILAVSLTTCALTMHKYTPFIAFVLGFIMNQFDLSPLVF